MGAVVASSGAIAGVLVGVLVFLFLVFLFLSSAIRVVTDYDGRSSSGSATCDPKPKARV